MRRGMTWVVLVAMVLSLVALPLPVLAQTANGPISSRNCDFQTSAKSTTGASTNTCDVAGFTTLTIQIGGTTAGSVQAQGTVDGTNYAPLLCYNLPQLVQFGSMTTTGVYVCSVKGYSRARLNWLIAGSSATGSGIALVTSFATSNF